MKRRQGFVSNSSSSSFVIMNKHLSLDQIDDIVNHSEVAKKSMPEIKWPEDSWRIDVTYEFITGNTCMNNFDMETFLSNIGVKEEHITWDEEDMY